MISNVQMTCERRVMPNNNQLSGLLLKAFKDKKYSVCLQELRTLAAYGDISAFIALAHIYFYGGDGVRRDYAAAMHWLDQINLENEPTGYAAHRLGIIYYKGLSVETDHYRAFKYFRKSALQGNRLSLLMVAAMLKEGDGTPAKIRTSKIIFWSCARDKKINGFMRLFSFLWVLPFAKRWIISKSGSL